MFNAEIGGQIAWLLPAALILLRRPGWSPSAGPRAPTAPCGVRSCGAAGCWSPAWCSAYMAGIFHAYYTVALAPAIAALVGMGARAAVAAPRCRCGRGSCWRRPLAGTALWAWVLLDPVRRLLPWLRWLVLVVGLVAAVGLLVADRVGRAVAATLVALGLLAALAGPAAYAARHRGDGAHRLDPRPPAPADGRRLRRDRRRPGGTRPPGGRPTGRPRRAAR